MIVRSQILESSTNHIMVALSETEIGKVILPNNLKFVSVNTGEELDFMNNDPTIDKEIVSLKYANSINDLMPKFIRKQNWYSEDKKEHEMMVMERLEILPLNHFDLQTRTIMMESLAEKMKELHDKMYVHGDFMRPTNFFNRGDKAWMFENIVQTKDSLRLIDAGFGTICTRENVKMFVSIMMREREEIEYFRNYYLS